MSDTSVSRPELLDDRLAERRVRVRDMNVLAEMLLELNGEADDERASVMLHLQTHEGDFILERRTGESSDPRVWLHAYNPDTQQVDVFSMDSIADLQAAPPGRSLLHATPDVLDKTTRAMMNHGIDILVQGTRQAHRSRGVGGWWVTFKKQLGNAALPAVDIALQRVGASDTYMYELQGAQVRSLQGRYSDLPEDYPVPPGKELGLAWLLHTYHHGLTQPMMSRETSARAATELEVQSDSISRSEAEMPDHLFFLMVNSPTAVDHLEDFEATDHEPACQIVRAVTELTIPELKLDGESCVIGIMNDGKRIFMEVIGDCEGGPLHAGLSVGIEEQGARGWVRFREDRSQSRGLRGAPVSYIVTQVIQQLHVAFIEGRVAPWDLAQAAGFQHGKFKGKIRSVYD